MKISIITVCRNAENTIAKTMTSVYAQNYENSEYIIIDGASSDDTVGEIKKIIRKGSLLISEPDMGIYDAMNKGIGHATGDLIGFLNADDFFATDNSLTIIAKEFSAKKISACYGDLLYIDDNRDGAVVRHYSSKKFTNKSLSFGIMPAHPTLYLKRKVFDKYGIFKTDYKIAADFEFAARIFGKNQIAASYIPKVLVKMGIGGISTRSFSNNITINKEIVRACRENEIDTNLFKVYLKYFKKVFELKIV